MKSPNAPQTYESKFAIASKTILISDHLFVNIFVGKGFILTLAYMPTVFLIIVKSIFKRWPRTFIIDAKSYLVGYNFSGG